jgi:beta-N-acetylhexosaminidase
VLRRAAPIPGLLAALFVLACARPALRTAVSGRDGIDPLLSSLTLEEKVGQMFVIGGSGYFLNEESPGFKELKHEVVDEHVGGVVWFRSEVYAAAILNARLQRLAKVPLLVAADLEAGTGMRFEDLTYGPWAMALAATGDPLLAERRARAVAEQARALGITQVYAPVADVNINPDNPVINVRSFGEDPEDVARFVAATVRGLEAGGVLATLKHFPGHGDVTLDSHCALPTLNAETSVRVEGRIGLARSAAGRERLDAVELVPFRAGIAAGASSVMMAHIAVPSLDPSPVPPLRAGVTSSDCLTTERPVPVGSGTTPATLSAPIIGLLRNDLGFQGLVVSDAMRMGGIVIHYEPGDAAVRAILAGEDQILLSPDTDAAITAVVRAVKDGTIPQARLDASVRRILAAKEHLGLFRERTPPLGALDTAVGSPAYEALEEEIARRSLTLVREAPGALPLRGRKLCVITVADEATLNEPLAPFLAELTARGAEHASARLDPRSTPEDVARALETARAADAVLLAFTVRTRSGAGQKTAPPAAHETAERLLELGKPVVAVSFGNPYILRDFPQLPTYACAYGIQDVVQVAAARALLGEAPFTGRLPVTIPELAPRGSGIQKPIDVAPR